METLKNISMDNFDFRSLNTPSAALSNYNWKSKNETVSWSNGALGERLDVVIEGQTDFTFSNSISPSTPTRLYGADCQVKLNDVDYIDLSSIKLYDGEYYDSRTQLAHKKTRTYELTGSEKMYVYEYNGLRGIQFYNLIPETKYRQKGICTHENKVGAYKETQGSYLWIGYNNQSVYWIGILDVLGLADASQFGAWLIMQKENGFPVKFQYVTDDEYTVSVAANPVIQADNINRLSNNHQENNWKEVEVIYRGQPEILQDEVNGQIIWEKTVEQNLTSSNSNISFSGNRFRPLKKLIAKGIETSQVLWTGYNLFDPSTVQDVNQYINKANGRTVVPTTGQWRSSDYIPVRSNIGYMIKENVIASASSAGLAFFDANKTFLKGYSSTELQKAKGIITSQKNSAYIRFSWNISGNENWRDGDVWIYDYSIYGNTLPYEPYVGRVPAPNPLYQQPVLCNNDIWDINGTTVDLSQYQLRKLEEAQDIIDIQSGEIIRAVGVVDLGELDYTEIGQNCFRSVQSIEDYIPSMDYDPEVSSKCDGFRVVAVSSAPSHDMELNFSAYKKQVQVKCSLAATAAEFKNLVQGIKFYYQLVSPIKEKLNTVPVQQIKGENTVSRINGQSDNEIYLEYFTHI